MSSQPTEQALVKRFLKMTSGFSQERAAKAVGVSQKQVSRWRAGEIPALQRRTIAALEAYIEERRRVDREAEELHDAERAEYDAEERAAHDLIVDPELVRRLVGRMDAGHVRSRLAIIHTYEEAYVERGLTVPDWLETIRAEIIRAGSSK